MIETKSLACPKTMFACNLQNIGCTSIKVESILPYLIPGGQIIGHEIPTSQGFKPRVSQFAIPQKSPGHRACQERSVRTRCWSQDDLEAQKCCAMLCPSDTQPQPIPTVIIWGFPYMGVPQNARFIWKKSIYKWMITIWVPLLLGNLHIE